MVRLHLLGRPAVVGPDGTEVAALRAQPKLLALLAYLGATPGMHSRETILGLLWPDSDSERARASLRQALYTIRQTLGRECLRADGKGLIGVDASALACDAVEFGRLLEDGRDEEALALYGGPFMDGLHVTGAPELDHWMDGQRRALQLGAVAAAWRLVEAADAAGESAASMRWAERALELAPYDEAGFRRYMELLAAQGDRALALLVYERLAAKLHSDLEVMPSTETMALAERLRQHEMLVGEPPSTGSTPQAIPGRIITGDPETVRAQRRAVPANVEAVGPRALEKVPADRFESMRGFDGALADEHFPHTSPASVGAAAVEPRAGAERMPPGVLLRDPRFIATAAVALLALALWTRSMSPDPPTSALQPVVRTSTPVGEGLSVQNGTGLAISPPGDVIAWLQLEDGGTHRLFVRRTDATAAQVVPGGENAGAPYFSPDGNWLAFVTESGDLVKVSLTGGQPLTIARGAGLRGIHWSDAGVIVGQGAGGIYAVPEAGGEPRLIVDEGLARWAEMLPGGKAVVYTRPAFGDYILLADLETGERRTLVANGTDPRYVSTGHLLFGRQDNSLFAVPFDLESLTVTGEPARVLEPVRVEGGATQFAVARNGTAVYLTASPSPSERELVVIGTDRSEQILPLRETAPRDPRWAPDGERLAYASSGSVYVYSMLTGTNVPISGEYTARFPVWSADGHSITMSVTGTGTDEVDGARAPADGSAPPELLYKRRRQNYPLAWLADGRLLVVEGSRDRGADLLIYSFDGDSVIESGYLTADWPEWAGSISPDGAWLAYRSTESGRPEIYVRRFPEPTEKVPISRDGGAEPRWSHDGRTIYYREGHTYRESNTLMAARLEAGPGSRVAAYDTIFSGETHYLSASNWAQYDIHPGGDRILVTRNRGDPTAEIRDEMVVVVNWFQELDARLRTAAAPPAPPR